MNINGEELLLLIIIAVIVIGPERLPAYAEQLGQLVRNLKKMATGATERVKEELGEEAEDLDLSQFDPRKYDPRRIVREALADDVLPPSRPVRPARTTGSRPVSSVRSPRTTPPNQAARRRSETAGKKTDDDAQTTVTSAGTAAVTEGKTQISAAPGETNATRPSAGLAAGAAAAAGTNGKPEPGSVAAGGAEPDAGQGAADQHTAALPAADEPAPAPPEAPAGTSEAEDLVPAGAPFDDEAT
mgnify:CR=1 FL=1